MQSTNCNLDCFVRDTEIKHKLASCMHSMSLLSIHTYYFVLQALICLNLGANGLVTQGLNGIDIYRDNSNISKG